MAFFIYQLKQALLSLKQKPTFVFSVVTTMGITLGALLCVLTLAYVMLIKPLPYPEQEKLVYVDHALINAQGENNLTAFTYPGLIELHENETVFENSALLNYENSIITSLLNQPKIATAFVTPEWFKLLGAQFILGRGFERTEALNTFNPVAVITYKTWKQEFNLESEILNKKITINGISFNIIGVLARSFVEPKLRNNELVSGIWLPWDFNSNAFLANEWGQIRPSFVFLGKLKDNLSIYQAEQVLTPLVNNTWLKNVDSFDFFNGWSISMKVRTLKNVIVGNGHNTTLLLLTACLGLVVICCANIVNLFVYRTAEKSRDLAIHVALGAKSNQLSTQVIVETFMLMLVSTIVALIVASFGFMAIQNYLFVMLPRVDELAINEASITSAICLLFVLTYFFSRICHNHLRYKSLKTLLPSGSKNIGFQVSKKVRLYIITSQVAIATALVFINLNFFLSALDRIQQPLGFELDNTLHIAISSSSIKELTDDETNNVMNQTIIKLLQIPEVETLSRSTSPLEKSGPSALTSIETNIKYAPETRYIDNNYFQLLEQPLIEGRYFNKEDIRDNNNVIIINDAFARQLDSENSVIGKKLRHPLRIYTVIGVVQGIKMPGEDAVPIRIYKTEPLNNTRILMKTAGNSFISRDKIVEILQSIDKKWTVFNYVNLNKSKIILLIIPITIAITSLLITIITLFLATLGVFGVLSYSTQMRRFEIGTRMAIGAKRRDIIALVIKENASAILIGVAVAIVCLLALYLGFSQYLAQFINTQLIFVAVITLLAIALVTFIACYLPLKRYIKQPVSYCLKGSE